MEHDARKMTALVLLLLLLGAGVVGVGYAAFSGTASTYNQDNSATAGYMYLDGNWNEISVAANELPLSTYTYKNGTSTDNFVAFYFDDTPIDITIGDSSTPTYKAIQVPNASKEYTLNNITDEEITSITFTSKAVGATADYFTNATETTPATTGLNLSDFKYIMKVDCDGVAKYVLVDGNANSVTLNLGDAHAVPVDDSKVITLTLFVGYDDDGAVYIPDSRIGEAINASGNDAYDQMAHKVLVSKLGTKGPIDLEHVNFAFSVVDATPAPVTP